CLGPVLRSAGGVKDESAFESEKHEQYSHIEPGQQPGEPAELALPRHARRSGGFRAGGDHGAFSTWPGYAMLYSNVAYRKAGGPHTPVAWRHPPESSPPRSGGLFAFPDRHGVAGYFSLAGYFTGAVVPRSIPGR